MQTEQEINDRLELMVGGPDRAFKLMNLYVKTGQTVSGDRFEIIPPKRTEESVFINLAKREGYSDSAIRFYVDNFVSE